MSTKPKVFLNEDQIVEYCKNNNIDPTICYCKDCGKFLAYPGAVFHINSITHKLVCDDNKLSFLSTRDYSGITYNLCRCYDCVASKYPKFTESKRLYSAKFAKYTQYGFGVDDNVFNAYVKSRQSVTKEKMIKKYGETEGKQRWKSYCNKQSETNKFEYKNKKYGMSQEEFAAYNKSRAVTLKNMIARHGEKEMG